MYSPVLLKVLWFDADFVSTLYNEDKQYLLIKEFISQLEQWQNAVYMDVKLIRIQTYTEQDIPNPDQVRARLKMIEVRMIHSAIYSELIALVII